MQAKRPLHIPLNTTSTLITAVTGLIGALAAVGLLVLGDGGILPRGHSASGPVGADVKDLALATVQISAVDKKSEEAWFGSGSIVSEDGLILTAAHIVEDAGSAYDHLEVAITDDVNEAPTGGYRATIEAVDYTLDLAVIKIDVANPLRRVRISESEPDILDPIRILGYPGTGGETLTASVGTISGFGSEEGIPGRAWIKTDATVTGGSSGGMAVNDKGQVIGVVVGFGSGSDQADLVDCRVISDANGDGVTDIADNCLPVGGYINALRPITLAKPLIEKRTTYSQELPMPDEAVSREYDSSKVVIENFDFMMKDLEGNVLTSSQGLLTEICATWEYSGMADGMRWDAVWYVNGWRHDELSQSRQRWDGGESGNIQDHSPVCIVDQVGLVSGLYEFALGVEGSFVFGDALFVGGDHPSVTLSIENRSNKRICEAHLSPSEALQGWGNNDLNGEQIPAGQTLTVEIPTGVYDLLLMDCNEEELDSRYGLEITGPHRLVFPAE